MKLNYNPPLLSRILLAISALVAVGVIFMFVSRALEPIPQPAPAPLRQADSFNPKADVSQSQTFSKLQSEDMVAVPDLPIGRQNPFMEQEQSAAAQINALGPTSTAPAEGIPIPGTTISIVPSVPVPTSTPEEINSETQSIPTYEPTNP